MTLTLYFLLHLGNNALLGINIKQASNSKGPNEPGVVVVRKEEIETSSVLDESVTRPIGLQMRRPPG